ncbi:PIN2/TERF1-interacting telomerase inhibitor 1 isoform X2 [Nematostella vectensis]|uniref:PIN2/TERF1-interacting telomerase inhibitor 1 isoform X2 n=1 Tax=Nematostella vectensis TaxID=45351 RepID=UPI0013903A82|nr:PIN2/TERF1-interacting telomerase inhibitor 1 isoform X2 [Nematostella vectensis]
MAMLAEKRSKQKWSHDPRNTSWSNDTSRFGYQMLEKMGWRSGKGLGAKGHGGTTHVKVSKKNNSLGLGANKYHEDNWLAHQDEFNELLAKLNSASDTSSTSTQETEKKARSSKKRVFYKRFVKSKDLSGYSDQDMACILGQRSKSAPATPVEQSEEEDSDDSAASCPDPVHTNLGGVTTIKAEHSVHEYFAKKMAELKAKRMSGNNDESSASRETDKDASAVSSDVSEDESCQAERKKKNKKSKIKKREKEEKYGLCNHESQKEKEISICKGSDQGLVEKELFSLKKKGKKAKKAKNVKTVKEVDMDDSDGSANAVKAKEQTSRTKRKGKKEKRKRKTEVIEISDNEASDTGKAKETKIKKKKDKERVESILEISDSESAENDENNSKKKKPKSSLGSDSSKSTKKAKKRERKEQGGVAKKKKRKD